jgi:hypothetical protein
VTGNIITLGIPVRQMQFMMKKPRPISTVLFEKLINVLVLIEESAPTLGQTSNLETSFSLLRGLSPEANYTDRATAACRRSK